jgi:lysophospholipase L1-like esterase
MHSPGHRALATLRLPLVLVTALALLATACSGDRSSATPARPSPNRSAASTSPAPPATRPRPTTTPAPRHYVSLGDSYSAGEGLPDPVQPCGRTPGAYPSLVAERAGLVPSLHACNGATTADVLDDEQDPGAGRQIDAVAADTDVVTITIGGNDIGFRRVMTDCVLASLPCTRLADQVTAALAGLGPRLLDVYREVRRRAPHARLLVIGYPQLVVDPAAATTGSCAGMTLDEVRWVRDEGDALDAVIKAAAATAGASYIDTAGPFSGHEACTAQPWMEGVNLSDVVASFHPNPAGQEELARLVLDALSRA